MKKDFLDFRLLQKNRIPYLFFLMSLFLWIACGNDDNDTNTNLPEVSVNFEINLNLPQYNDLKFPGGSAVIKNGVGIKGLVVHNLNGALFTAFELSDPNHVPNNCSELSLQGIVATCGCKDGNAYNIINGQSVAGRGNFGLKPYRVIAKGNSLLIVN